MSHKISSILDQLREQSQMVVDKVYGMTGGPFIVTYTAPWACKAVFQSLSMQAKVLVMKLLLLTTAISIDDIYGWFNPATTSPKTQESTLEELLSVRILVNHEVSESSIDDYAVHTQSKEPSQQLLMLNKHFRSSFSRALANPCEPWKNSSTSGGANSFLIPLELLDSFSREGWDYLISHLVGVNIGVVGNVRGARLNRRQQLVGQYVASADLMKDGNITSSGYEYLLKTYRDQVWQFVNQMAKSCPRPDEALSLLFMLAYCEVQHRYSIEPLTPAQQQMVLDFHLLGLLYMTQEDAELLYSDLEECGEFGNVREVFFYPTRIAASVVFASADPRASGHVANDLQGMRIIVETNQQVVAYINSELHYALLKLFVEVHLRLPNMAMGRLTKEHSKKAFRMGIKAAQVIDFLIMHAHPLVKYKDNILPANVTDQLALWENENYRIKTREAVVVECRNAIQGVLLNYRPNSTAINVMSEVFASLVQSLQKVGLLLWGNAETMTIAIPPIDNFLRVVQSYIESCVADVVR